MMMSRTLGVKHIEGIRSCIPNRKVWVGPPKPLYKDRPLPRMPRKESGYPVDGMVSWDPYAVASVINSLASDVWYA